MSNKAFSLLKSNIRYLPILLIWLLGFFLRTYRQNDLLGFYYDQGRDAKIANDIINGTNFPAIGPTTGIQGLHLGPAWFYLITPGYFFSGGNPATASCFIAFLESLTIPMLYFILKKYWNHTGAILAACFWAFSNYIIRSSRWFSNPSPLPFFVMLMIYCLIQIITHRKHSYLVWLSLLLGITLQLEAASAIFFIPTILVLFLYHLPKIKKVKLTDWLKSLAVFLILLLPQLAFEIKNNFKITRSFLSFLVGKTNSVSGKSFDIPNIPFLWQRLQNYYHYLFSKLDTNVTPYSLLLLLSFFLGLVLLLKKHRQNTVFQILLFWTFIPLFLLLFFVGNYGTLYDYYLTGFYPSFFALFAMSITSWQNKFSKFLLIFMVGLIFFFGNVPYVVNYLSAGFDGPQHITLGNQKQSIEHICQLSLQGDYNLSIYVPPHVPHTYEYLLDWYQEQGKCLPQTKETTSNLYILYEIDPNNPQRLEQWLKDLDKYSTFNNQALYGGITVQQRSNLL